MENRKNQTIITIPAQTFIINATPRTILEAYNKRDTAICEAHGTMSPTDTSINTNLSEIASKIIEKVGRFTERYANDMFYDWAKVEAVLQPRAIEHEENYVFAFGIRDSGVDHNEFIIARFQQSTHPMDYIHVGHSYRKILAVGVKLTPCVLRNGADVFVQLKDITHNFLRLADSDKEVVS